MARKPYFDIVKQSGSAAVTTIYLSRVPIGKVLHVEHLAATVWTTVPGDYATAKYIMLGFELGTNKFYLDGNDVYPATTNDRHAVVVKDFTIPEGARLFAEFEAVTTSETYQVSATGIFYDKEKN